MPRRRVTPKQAAASRRNLVKARAARKSRDRYTGKAGLPHVEYSFGKSFSGNAKVFRATSFDPRTGKQTGEAYGIQLRKTLHISDVSKLTPDKVISNGYSINDYKSSHPKAPTLEPGASLLTAAARVARGKALRVNLAVRQANSFYVLTGGKRVGTDMTYSRKAKASLAGRRIVRVRKRK